jgi:hypothetical protein
MSINIKINIMTPEEMRLELDAKFAQVQVDLAEAQKNNATKTVITALTKSIQVQGESLYAFI